jgi:RNA polymerase sigma-70 factor (ECF subfamily)
MTGYSGNHDVSQCSDQDLVAGALRDKQAFAAIVQRYQTPLFRYIIRQGCRDNGMAKDLLQEVFIKTYLHLNDYDPTLSFSSWIYRIAHNETVSHFRKEKSRPFVLDKGEFGELLEKISDDLDMDNRDRRCYSASDIQEALVRLEVRYRDVIVLRFFEEKSYDEISDILQMPAGTVATLLNRAKKKIKSCLGTK